MRAVVQRVREAQVEVDQEVVGSIKQGIMLLLGVAEGDTDKDSDYLVQKVLNLRIFEDAEGKMNRSLLDVGGELLVVSQFTLLGDCRKGRRPGFSAAAPPDEGDRLYRYFCKQAAIEVPVATGIFQTDMQVQLINDGPITMLLDSRKDF